MSESLRAAEFKRYVISLLQDCSGGTAMVLGGDPGTLSRTAQCKEVLDLRNQTCDDQAQDSRLFRFSDQPMKELVG
jgi:hypothetical protein